MDEIDDRQQQAEPAEQIAAAAAEGRRQRDELISVLKQHDEFHLRTRNKIDELVEEFLTINDPFDLSTRNEIDELVEEFLTRTKDDLYNMLCDRNNVDVDDNDHVYCGLNSDRDTETEIETALRFFPEVLSRRGGPFNRYPIQYLAIACTYEKAIPFIPLLARLALELGLFEEKERGGLLFVDTTGYNILQFLVNDMKNRQHSDHMYLNVMIQLRQMGYLKKEDIKKYGLVVILCRCRHVISEKRFRFLVEWDPTSLIKTDGQTGKLPLHFAATYTIQNFRMVFEYGIRYYPKKKGISLLFFKKSYTFSRTPFQLACKEFGYEEVMKVVEGILISYSDTPINITEALLTAAIDENIHLDCVYFLLRREPDVVMKLMSSSSILTSLKSESNENNNKKDESNDGGSSSDNDMHSVKNNNNLMATTNPIKRKRKEREDDENKLNRYKRCP
ncbi:hypothetical protein FRACYDRAFT_241028 [Fragilariopsis cylindrus CCMP1102]|uniref:Ankyrin n=1 Tax=Fragilariopsis cylindrus CCMP1102 TaxID=635003 RepID=A0A1E7F9G9_9STRA|nr:hypothetical protein FRACYDRAFT_241028 [Fragilariopsis cylindrus CCMP1102]|eukprot:OEU14483.1 hypothetical protein FRACYDRAFT_241028 [Fragilariopsis cylindrus CCMP1102]